MHSVFQTYGFLILLLTVMAENIFLRSDQTNLAAPRHMRSRGYIRLVLQARYILPSLGAKMTAASIEPND